MGGFLLLKIPGGIYRGGGSRRLSAATWGIFPEGQRHTN